MIADKRLKALALCVSDDSVRPAIQKVHIKGNKAEATNGEILAEAQFNEFPDDAFPTCPGADPGDNSIYVSADNIKKAFSGCPKRSAVIPIIKNIRIAQDIFKHGDIDVDVVHLTGTDLETPITVEETQEPATVYPKTAQVWPQDTPENAKYFSLTLPNLQKLIALMKSVDTEPKRINFRVDAEESAIVFYIPGDASAYGTDGIHGLVMPCRFDEDEKAVMKSHKPMQHTTDNPAKTP